MARQRIADDEPKREVGQHGPNRALPEPVDMSADPVLAGLGDLSIPEARYLRAWMECEGDAKAVLRACGGSKAFVSWAQRQPRVQEAIRKSIQSKLLGEGSPNAAKVLMDMVEPISEIDGLKALANEGAAALLARKYDKERRAAAIAVLNLAGIVAPKAPEAPRADDKPLAEMTRAELMARHAELQRRIEQAEVVEGFAEPTSGE